MIILNEEKRMCLSCMDEHNVKSVMVEETSVFKDVEVVFDAEYEYCENDDMFLETEEQIKKNDLALKDAYREKVGLLTSARIKAIREKYNISQKQLAEVLGWGAATIIRYENHQVQDRAHDDILRKIESDPRWFIEMLDRIKEKIDEYYYIEYRKAALAHLERMSTFYGNTRIRYTEDRIETAELSMNRQILCSNYSFFPEVVAPKNIFEYSMSNSVATIGLAS